MKLRVAFVGILFLLSQFVAKGQEEFILSIFESIKSDDPTGFYELYVLDNKVHKEIFGKDRNYEENLEEYKRDRYAAFYEIIRKIDDHTKITVDSIQGLTNQKSFLIPKIFFSTEEMNCSCKFIITKHEREDWIVTKLEPRARCKKKKNR